MASCVLRLTMHPALQSYCVNSPISIAYLYTKAHILPRCCLNNINEFAAIYTKYLYTNFVVLRAGQKLLMGQKY